MNSNIILVFGSFNPPTIAHISMAKALHKQYPDYEICYVPAASEYIESCKEGKVLPIYMRSKLLRDAIKKYPYACTSNVERVLYYRLQGKTYNTVEFFKIFHDNVLICLGEDNLENIESWYMSDEFIKENKFIIMIREGHPKLRLDMDCEIVPLPYPNVSSTAVRDAYRKGDFRTIKKLVPRNVYKYLKKNKKGDLF